MSAFLVSKCRVTLTPNIWNMAILNVENNDPEPEIIHSPFYMCHHHCFHGFKPCFFHDHFWRCRQPPLLSTCARLGGGIGGSLGIKGGGLGTRMAHRTMAGLQIWTPKNGPLVHPKNEKRSTGVKHGKAPF